MTPDAVAVIDSVEKPTENWTRCEAIVRCAVSNREIDVRLANQSEGPDVITCVRTPATMDERREPLAAAPETAQ